MKSRLCRRMRRYGIIETGTDEVRGAAAALRRNTLVSGIICCSAGIEYFVKFRVNELPRGRAREVSGFRPLCGRPALSLLDPDPVQPGC